MLKPGSAIRCHSCNAIVPYEEGKSVAECSYCHAQVVLKDPNVAAMQSVAKSGGSSAGLVVGVVVAGVLLVVLGAVLVTGRAEPSAPPQAVLAPPPTPQTPTPPKPPPPPPPKPWKEVLSFGELGTGPGMFTEPRLVTVTDDGDYFVAERGTGRVQKFDAAGKFVLLTELPPDKLTKKKKTVFGMTADHAGHVWVVRNGDLLQLDAATGNIVHTINGDYPDTYFHGSVAVDAKNAVYATTDRMGDHDVVVFDAKYKKQHRLKNVHSEAVAVDGLGTLYVAKDDGVDVLGPDGAVKSRFAVKGGSRIIHVDDRGHFYVQDGGGVSVYEPGGAKLASFDLPAMNDFTLAKDGTLVALHSSGKVTTYALTLPSP